MQIQSKRYAALTKIRVLLVVSHVRHYVHNGQISAYGPYAREIDIWADLFEEVRIAAPCRSEAPSSDCLAFTRRNISLAPQRETGGDGVREKLAQILQLPLLMWDLLKAMRRADAIHVRCPGNLGLLGAMLAPLCSRYLIAKYSNQWSNFPGEPWTWKAQRQILRSKWWHGPVTVYASPAEARKNVVPFFTSIMTREQMALARAATQRKRRPGPLRILYVGRLSASKNVDKLLTAIAETKKQGLPVECKIMGEGPERRRLEAFCAIENLQSTVTFTGGVPYEAVLSEFAQADVLVLISETEGWPKAIAEGMAFGLICIGSKRGLVPQLLGEGRGITIPAGDSKALASTLVDIASNLEAYESMRCQAATWGQRFSLEMVRQELCTIFRKYWGVVIAAHDAEPGLSSAADQSVSCSQEESANPHIALT